VLSTWHWALATTEQESGRPVTGGIAFPLQTGAHVGTASIVDGDIRRVSAKEPIMSEAAMAKSNGVRLAELLW
jgi:hypothetical protein